MGVWKPATHRNTSNWKEFRTLTSTLEQALADNRDLSGKRLLYFTDNSTTYDICQRSYSSNHKLHEQVCLLRSLELQLRCRVICIHVPGLVMIRECTDGLSRGVMMTNLSRPNTAELLADIFRPPVFSADLLTAVLDLVEETPSLRSTALRSQRWLTRSDFSNWTRSKLLSQNVFGVFPPSLLNKLCSLQCRLGANHLRIPATSLLCLELCNESSDVSPSISAMLDKVGTSQRLFLLLCLF